MEVIYCKSPAFSVNQEKRLNILTSFTKNLKYIPVAYINPVLLLYVHALQLYYSSDVPTVPITLRNNDVVHSALQVLFVHKYSGGMILGSALLISSSYFMFAAVMVYIQHLTLGYQEPEVDLKYIGLLIFLVGICGNFYHHYLLSKLRDSKEKGYKIPRGGLFSVVICPHYLFEIIGFVGISFISQTSFSFYCALGVALYLMGRSYVTRKWYLSKFENFPKNVKALIPFVFQKIQFESAFCKNLLICLKNVVLRLFVNTFWKSFLKLNISLK